MTTKKNFNDGDALTAGSINEVYMQHIGYDTGSAISSNGNSVANLGSILVPANTVKTGIFVRGNFEVSSLNYFGSGAIYLMANDSEKQTINYAFVGVAAGGKQQRGMVPIEYWDEGETWTGSVLFKFVGSVHSSAITCKSISLEGA